MKSDPHDLPGLGEMAVSRVHHLPGGRFFNPWLKVSTKGLLPLIKWRLSRNKYAPQKRTDPEFPLDRPDFVRLESQDGDYIVWLGHSTVYLRQDGVRLLFDPIFGNIVGVWPRKTPLPISPYDLPGVDLVCITHDHHDHMDLASLRLLRERFDPTFVAGLGHKRSLAKAGVSKPVQLDWWDEMDWRAVKLRSVPVQHWCMRLGGLMDRALWCGFASTGRASRVIYLGDSGYFSELKDIGRELGPFDIALLPIGAYEPRWLMAEQHMDPAQAVQAALDLQARTFVPIHWGTFDLSDEPLDLPPVEVREAYATMKNDDPEIEQRLHLQVLNHGGSLALG